MSALCPSCVRRIPAGSLRCRHCGGDTRDVPRERPAPRVLALFDRVMQRQQRVREVFARLRIIAPQVRRWLEVQVGPVPDVHPRYRDEVEKLLHELKHARVLRLE